jgi:hypothetical protein
MTIDATLRLVPGAGHIARCTDAVLFLPEPDERLLDAFLASPRGSELQAVASATVAAGFDVKPFVGVQWTPSVRVMAFGAVQVETDQPSLPMLSGSGSRTWVEHSLSVAGDARIEVAASTTAADPATDLAGGVALAGGFRLELTTVDAAPDSAPPPAPVEATLVDATAGASRQGGPTAPAPIARPTGDAADDLAAIQAAAMGADGQPIHVVEAPGPDPRPFDEEAGDAPDAEITLPPPAPGQLLNDVMQLADEDQDADRREALVDAKLCPDGHPNPPFVASCAVCGQFLTPGAGAVVHVPRPSLGHLELDDGTVVELDHELIVGRNPDRDAATDRTELRTVTVAGEKVSRRHLEIRFQGWDVLVADCGSTNGTFVVPHAGGQVVAVEPGRAQLLEPGATVYFGDRSFVVVGRGSDEE